LLFSEPRVYEWQADKTRLKQENADNPVHPKGIVLWRPSLSLKAVHEY
jgi:hypothetical protein